MATDESRQSTDELDPDQTAAVRAALETAPGSLRHAISDAFVALYKEHYGKGPTKCRTFLDRDLVVVLLRGGFTAAEQTLLEAGRWQEVRDARTAWQEAMREKFNQQVEELTGRSVEAFMSTSHHDPDLTLEVFTLKPRGQS
jgi:uncharacterized protein YbcI